MPELSIIIPAVNEYPQSAFTIQNIYNELRDEVDFELIYIDNYCDELKAQRRTPDKGLEYLKSISNRHPWLKVLSYTDKLSHWNAKNLGIKEAKGEYLWFCDAHCGLGRGSLKAMFEYYKKAHVSLNGTLHLPLSYLLEKPGLELTYKLVADVPRGIAHYSFTRYQPSQVPYKVPCMSTCGMMITRDMMVNELGMWPSELGIYGGGENFINFTLAVLGRTINIFPAKYPLFHYAERRGYSWNSGDWLRNRAIASFIHSGPEFAKTMLKHAKGQELTKNRIFESIAGNHSVLDHRDKIEKASRMSIEDYCTKWSGK